MVEGWITRGVDAIAVERGEPGGHLDSAAQGARARHQGADLGCRRRAGRARFFINQATPEGIGYTLTDEAARMLGGKGEFAIITGALSAANQNEWIGFIKQRAGGEVSRT